MSRIVYLLLIFIFMCGCSTVPEQQLDSATVESEPAPMAVPAPAVMYDYDGNIIPDQSSAEPDDGANVPMVDRDQALTMLKAAYSDDNGIDYEVDYDASTDTYTISIKSDNMAQTALAAQHGNEPEATNWKNICDSVISVDGDARNLLSTLGYPASHVSACIISENGADVILFETRDGECVANVGDK